VLISFGTIYVHNHSIIIPFETK